MAVTSFNEAGARSPGRRSTLVGPQMEALTASTRPGREAPEDW